MTIINYVFEKIPPIYLFMLFRRNTNIHSLDIYFTGSAGGTIKTTRPRNNFTYFEMFTQVTRGRVKCPKNAQYTTDLGVF